MTPLHHITRRERIAYMVQNMASAAKGGYPDPVRYAVLVFGKAFKKPADWYENERDPEYDLHYDEE